MPGFVPARPGRPSVAPGSIAAAVKSIPIGYQVVQELCAEVGEFRSLLDVARDLSTLDGWDSCPMCSAAGVPSIFVCFGSGESSE